MLCLSTIKRAYNYSLNVDLELEQTNLNFQNLYLLMLTIEKYSTPDVVALLKNIELKLKSGPLKKNPLLYPLALQLALCT